MPKKVLVVEDSPGEMALIREALENRGYDLLTATDGESALELVTDSLPDVMVLDIELPKINGFQICRQIKASRSTRGIRIILLSARNRESDRFWGLKQGADEYMTKPFEATRLAASVERYL